MDKEYCMGCEQPAMVHVKRDLINGDSEYDLMYCPVCDEVSLVQKDEESN